MALFLGNIEEGVFGGVVILTEMINDVQTVRIAILSSLTIVREVSDNLLGVSVLTFYFLNSPRCNQPSVTGWEVEGPGI